MKLGIGVYLFQASFGMFLHLALCLQKAKYKKYPNKLCLVT